MIRRCAIGRADIRRHFRTADWLAILNEQTERQDVLGGFFDSTKKLDSTKVRFKNNDFVIETIFAWQERNAFGVPSRR